MKPRLIIPAVLVAGALLAAACGSDESSTESEPTDQVDEGSSDTTVTDSTEVDSVADLEAPASALDEIGFNQIAISVREAADTSDFEPSRQGRSG